jgi:hypothetical protein
MPCILPRPRIGPHIECFRLVSGLRPLIHIFVIVGEAGLDQRYRATSSSTLEGLMSALYLKQLAVHVRRGQAGRVREGLAGGSLTYGYAPVLGERRKRTIVAAQPAIIQRLSRSPST